MFRAGHVSLSFLSLQANYKSQAHESVSLSFASICLELGT